MLQHIWVWLWLYIWSHFGIRFNLKYLNFRKIFRFYHLPNKKKPPKLCSLQGKWLTYCYSKIVANKPGGLFSMWDLTLQINCQAVERALILWHNMQVGNVVTSDIWGQALLEGTALLSATWLQVSTPQEFNWSTDKVNQTYIAAGSERRISILLLRCIGHA